MSPPGDRLPARHLSADYRSTAHAQPQSRLDVVGRFASMFAEGERRGATTHSARWSPPANACKTLVKCLHGPTPYYSSVKRGCAGPLQAFYKRFSGPIGTFLSDRGGADAWQITTCGHGVLQTSPHA